mgnify:CR=1 FL=1
MEQSSSSNLSTGNAVEELPFSASLGMVTVLFVGDILSIVGNSLVLTAVIGNTKLRTNTNFFIMNLSVIDLIAGVLLIPLVIDSVLRKTTQQGHLCNFLAFVDSVYATATALTIACIAIDRYHSIVNCLHYEYLVTHTRTKLAIAWTWIQSVGIALCPVAKWGKYDFRQFQFKCSLQVPDKNGFLYFKVMTCIVVPYAITVFCYTRIHLVARRHARNMVRIQIQHNGKRTRRTHSSRKTRLVYLVVGLYSVCWLPIYSLKLMQTIAPHRPLSWPFLETIFTTLALLNGSFNPLVYALITTHYRAGLVRVYRRLRRRFAKRLPLGQDLSKSSFSFSKSVSSFYRYMAEREAMRSDMNSSRWKNANQRDSISVSNSKHSSGDREKGRKQGIIKQTLAIPNDRRSKLTLNITNENMNVGNGLQNEQQLTNAEESEKNVKTKVVSNEGNADATKQTTEISPPSSEDMCKDEADLKMDVTGPKVKGAKKKSMREKNGTVRYCFTFRKRKS